MDNLIIETEELTKYFGEISAVKDVHLHVKKGEIYGLLGRNGAGKTTIMKMLLGLTKPSNGTIQLFGKPFEKPEKSVLNRIGVMIETPGFYPNLTATENLEILASLRGVIQKDAVKKSLERVCLPYKDRKLYAEYSLGMKQRVGIAAAIIHDPELLILDEPVVRLLRCLPILSYPRTSAWHRFFPLSIRIETESLPYQAVGFFLARKVSGE